MVKKLLSLLCAALLVLTVTAGCGSKKTENHSGKPVLAKDLADERTSEDGCYEIAFITDGTPLEEGRTNREIYDSIKLFAYENGKSYRFYEPSGGKDTAERDRYTAIKNAVDGGAEVVVCAGIIYKTALSRAAAEFPNVRFLFLDGCSLSQQNVDCVSFREEQCGFLAGYAVVTEGYTRLGFCGGGNGMDASCCRYGYGYVQGAEAAAAEKNVNVEINYTWLYSDLMSEWYDNSTEVIFACGDDVFDSVAESASAYQVSVIGADFDRSFDSQTVITSAAKAMGKAAEYALKKIYSSEAVSSCGDVCLGIREEAIHLPVDTWSLQNWSVESYSAFYDRFKSGAFAVDSTVLYGDEIASVSLEHVTLNYVDSWK